MNRIRLRSGPLALFGAVFVVALVVLLPLRLALSWFDLGNAGLAAREVSGSVWSGSLREASVGGIALGDIGARTSPLHLLLGRARVGLRGTGARPFTGAITISRHSIGLNDATATLAAGTVHAPVPVSALDLDAVSVQFRDGACEKAEGRVRAVLSGDLAGIDLGQGLSGAARCDGGALLLPLTSQGGSESVALRLWSSGRFRAELSVQPRDPAATAKLVLNGFQPGPRGYTLTAEGTF